MCNDLELFKKSEVKMKAKISYAFHPNILLKAGSYEIVTILMMSSLYLLFTQIISNQNSDNLGLENVHIQIISHFKI